MRPPASAIAEHHWNFVTYLQGRKLSAGGREECVGVNHKRGDALLGGAGDSGIDLLRCAGGQYDYLLPDAPSSFPGFWVQQRERPMAPIWGTAAPACGSRAARARR
jgi:hypothetical protein